MWTLVCSEPRAQVEQLHGRCVLTGQEAPECNRKFREDLFKKFCSGDAISGCKPYGMRTRMIHVVGFKHGVLRFHSHTGSRISFASPRDLLAGGTSLASGR